MQVLTRIILAEDLSYTRESPPGPDHHWVTLQDLEEIRLLESVAKRALDELNHFLYNIL